MHNWRLATQPALLTYTGPSLGEWAATALSSSKQLEQPFGMAILATSQDLPWQLVIFIEFIELTRPCISVAQRLSTSLESPLYRRSDVVFCASLLHPLLHNPTYHLQECLYPSPACLSSSATTSSASPLGLLHTGTLIASSTTAPPPPSMPTPVRRMVLQLPLPNPSTTARLRDERCLLILARSSRTREVGSGI